MQRSSSNSTRRGSVSLCGFVPRSPSGWMGGDLRVSISPIEISGVGIDTTPTHVGTTDLFVVVWRSTKTRKRTTVDGGAAGGA